MHYLGLKGNLTLGQGKGMEINFTPTPYLLCGPQRKSRKKSFVPVALQKGIHR
jgi:hypothetical protein